MFLHEIKAYFVLGNGRRGFTLIELLVGLTVSCALALSLGAVFSSNLRMWGASQAVAEYAWENFLISNELSRDIGKMIENKKLATGTFSPFCGGDSCSFLVATATGVSLVRYFLEVPAAGTVQQTILGKKTKRNIAIREESISASRQADLIREERPLVTSSLNDGQREILSRHIENMSLKFNFAYHKSGATEEILWEDKWREDAAPLRILVRMKWADAKGNLVRDLREEIILPPQIKQEGAI